MRIKFVVVVVVVVVVVIVVVVVRVSSLWLRKHFAHGKNSLPPNPYTPSIFHFSCLSKIIPFFPVALSPYVPRHGHYSTTYLCIHFTFPGRG